MWVAWLGAGALVLLGGMVLLASRLPDPGVLYVEGAILEVASLCAWVLGALLGGWGLVRAENPAGRTAAAWLAIVCVLAGLRELDAETLLNPESLGAWGVRYKLSWWIDGSVPLWLKLGWGLIFCVAALGLALPLVRIRGELRRLWANPDPRVPLFGAAVCFLALGFVFDDLLRGSTLLPVRTRQLLEETCEFIGALYFLGLVLLQLRKSGAQAGERTPRHRTRDHE